MTITILPQGRRGFIECANFGEPVLHFLTVIISKALDRVKRGIFLPD